MSKISVIICEPGEKARYADIENDLKTMQNIVDGYIEALMPFNNDICIICNEEGKMNSLSLNRTIYDENENIIDIIAGTFVLCWAPIDSEEFESLPEKVAEEMFNKFYEPEEFFYTGDEFDYSMDFDL